MLGFFMAYFCSITLFSHVHIINGVTIVHSHPFKQGHTHSQEQAINLFSLSHFLSVETDECLVEKPTPVCLYAFDCLHDTSAVSSCQFECPSLRGPPSFCIA